jgi:HAD superfamily hydrolase (TIGR01549 family)
MATSLGSRARGARAVVFDLDGTLICDEHLDYSEAKRLVGARPGEGILEAVARAPESERSALAQLVVDWEVRSRESRTVQHPGALEFALSLKEKGVRLGILTRNETAAFHHAAQKLGWPEELFEVVVGRDGPYQKAKPDPEPLLGIARALGVPAGEESQSLFMIGDSKDDMECGARAGATTILVSLTDRKRENSHKHREHAHFEYTAYSDLHRDWHERY